MTENEAKSLEVLVYSPGWKVLKDLMEEQIESLTERICDPNTSVDETIKLRAERVAAKRLIEQPVLTIKEFET